MREPVPASRRGQTSELNSSSSSRSTVDWGKLVDWNKVATSLVVATAPALMKRALKSRLSPFTYGLVAFAGLSLLNRWVQQLETKRQ